MTVDEILNEVVEDGVDITITGGDPFYQPTELLELVTKLYFLRKNIWVYTGFTIDQVYNNPDTSRILDFINVLVDGPYIEALRDTTGFKGSKNQRIINLHR